MHHRPADKLCVVNNIGSDLRQLCLQVAVTTVTHSNPLLLRKLLYPGIYHCFSCYGCRDRVQVETKCVNLRRCGVCMYLMHLALCVRP